MFAEELARRIRGICTLSTEQMERLQAHYELLLRWNRVVNLTAIRDEAEIIERHYCESLFLGAHLPAGSSRIADIGSGAGFPGFPVAVLRRECQVTLIEAHRRKAAFLKEAVRGLGNARVLAERAESVTETFDWVISRAVKYSDIAEAASRLAPQIAVLTSENAQDAIPLPWGERRYLMFHVKHSLS